MSSYPLRLPLELDLAARAQAKALGISLNAFICVATDAYLKKDALLVVPAAPEPLPVAPVMAPAVRCACSCA